MKWLGWLLILYCPVGVSGQPFTRTYFDRQGVECSSESYCYRVSKKLRDPFSYDTIKFYYTQNNRLQA